MKDNFDDILKKKWEQFHFDVDDQHRRDMILLLDKSRRRKTGLFWWLGGIVSGLAIAILLISTGQPMSAIDTPSLNEQSIHSAAEQDKALNTTQMKNEEATIPPHTTTLQESRTVEDMNSHLQNESRTTSPVPPAMEGRDHSQKGTQTHHSKPNSKINHIDIHASSDKNTLSTPTFDSPSEKIADETEKSRSEMNDIVESVSAADETDHNQQTGEIAENRNAIVYPPSDALMLAVRDESFITDPVDALQIQSLQFSRDIPQAIVPASVYKKSLALFAEAGAGIVPGMQSEFTTGWTVRGGGGLLYNITPKNSISFSSGYMMQDGGFDFDKTSTVQTNSFGLRSSFNSLSPDRLHFVYGRVGVHHSIKRHMISFFGGTQFLYGAQGEIVVQTQDALAGGSETKERAWLKLDGMKRWLWSTEAQYGYRITPRLALHTGIKYYFTNIEAKDPELQSKGFYWNGKMAQVNPFFTLNYQLYERN